MQQLAVRYDVWSLLSVSNITWSLLAVYNFIFVIYYCLSTM